MTNIKEYHAHVYFDEKTYDQAVKLCEKAGEIFTLTVGRFFKRPVGPHLYWSCQLAFESDVFANIVPWLALNRDGLTIFIHPDTGDHLKDHTEHAIWMGEMMELDMSALS